MSTCFVAIPAIASFDAYYREVLVRAIVRAGLEPVRAEDIDKHRAVTDQIFAGVSEAAICVLDLSSRSTTVLYALGLAHGLGKRIVLLAQSPDDVPYDLRFGRYIVYRPGTARWEDMLSLQLQAELRESLAVRLGTVP
jgi:hypothetical protein